jgi:hypothetical protein
MPAGNLSLISATESDTLCRIKKIIFDISCHNAIDIKIYIYDVGCPSIVDIINLYSG